MLFLLTVAMLAVLAAAAAARFSGASIAARVERWAERRCALCVRASRARLQELHAGRFC